jgi:hypothetical protein
MTTMPCALLLVSQAGDQAKTKANTKGSPGARAKGREPAKLVPERVEIPNVENPPPKRDPRLGEKCVIYRRNPDVEGLVAAETPDDVKRVRGFMEKYAVRMIYGKAVELPNGVRLHPVPLGRIVIVNESARVLLPDGTEPIYIKVKPDAPGSFRSDTPTFIEKGLWIPWRDVLPLADTPAEEVTAALKDVEARLRRLADRAKEQAEATGRLVSKLRLGKSLEKTNPKAALGYYREVAKNAPAGSAEAKQAAERIKALGGDASQAKPQSKR